MCGICGLLFSEQRNPYEIGPVILSMTNSLKHRGPNASDIWINPNNNVFFGHSRLSIQDLSQAGAQPMISESKKLAITFNGEIYNHLSIRKNLDRSRWNSTSDTETILYAIEEKGLRWFLMHASGMFSLAVYNLESSVLFLANDKFGEKPLYFSKDNKHFLFGSELKALKLSKLFQPKINRKALALYTRLGYVPAPYSIYENVHKIVPGTFIEVPISEGCIKDMNTVHYWDTQEKAISSLENPFSGSFQDAVIEGESLLLSSVSERMLSDVPVGAFLSGGIDSSLISAMMQKSSDNKIKTFTMGFNEEGYDESQQAAYVAQHLDTDHTELIVTSDLALDVIPQLPNIYDEPFSDSSQIPTYLLSKMTAEHVTVALSGDAGDEVFGGYNRHVSTLKLWEKIKKIPLPIRTKISSMVMAISPRSFGTIYNFLIKITPLIERIEHFPDKAQKLANIMKCNSLDEIYLSLISTWDNPNTLINNVKEPKSLANNILKYPVLNHFEHSIMLLDTQTYLPGDILTKVDRASMASSLETRLPFLDHNVFEFAWRLPLNYKIKDNKGKYILRSILSRHVPKELWDRPKKGFSVPLDTWLRGPLKEWASELLNPKKIAKQGYFNQDEIAKKWKEHQSGKHNWQDLLWNILMFQAWLENEELA